MNPIYFGDSGLRPGQFEEVMSRSRANRTDADWKASEPSLSAAVGAVIERAKKEPDLRSKETQ